MKKKNLIIGSISFIAMGIVSITACGNSDHDSEHNHDVAMSLEHGEQNHMAEKVYSNDRDEKTEGVELFNVTKSTVASEIIEAYLGIVNALIDDNDVKAAQSGNKLATALTKMDLSSLSEGQVNEAKEIVENSIENAEHVSENEGNIEHQREHLAELYADLKDLIAITGSDRTMYEIYCPMANNKQGAMWLSNSNDIRNPYMGSKMLKCGTVKTEISIL